MRVCAGRATVTSAVVRAVRRRPPLCASEKGSRIRSIAPQRPTKIGATPPALVVRTDVHERGDPAGAARAFAVCTTPPICAAKRSHSETAVPTIRAPSRKDQSSGRTSALTLPGPVAALAVMNATTAARKGPVGRIVDRGSGDAVGRRTGDDAEGLTVRAGAEEDGAVELGAHGAADVAPDRGFEGRAALEHRLAADAELDAEVLLGLEGAVGGGEGRRPGHVGEFAIGPARGDARRGDGPLDRAAVDGDKLRAHLRGDRGREQPVDDRPGLDRVRGAAGNRLARALFERQQGNRDAAVAATRAQLLHHLGRAPVEGPAFIEAKNRLPQFEAGDQFGELPAVPGLDLRSCLAALGVLGDQSRAIAGLVGAILPIQRLHGSRLILGRLGLGREFRELLPDLALPARQFDRSQHLCYFLKLS